ncbi:unnamed protein product [Prunus brigantina]
MLDHIYSMDDGLEVGGPLLSLEDASENPIVGNEPLPETAPIIEPTSISRCFVLWSGGGALLPIPLCVHGESLPLPLKTWRISPAFQFAATGFCGEALLLLPAPRFGSVTGYNILVMQTDKDLPNSAFREKRIRNYGRGDPPEFWFLASAETFTFVPFYADVSDTVEVPVAMSQSGQFRKRQFGLDQGVPTNPLVADPFALHRVFWSNDPILNCCRPLVADPFVLHKVLTMLNPSRLPSLLEPLPRLLS